MSVLLTAISLAPARTTHSVNIYLTNDCVGSQEGSHPQSQWKGSRTQRGKVKVRFPRALPEPPAPDSA